MFGLSTFGLNDAQLATVAAAATRLPIDKARIFAERLRARLEQRGLTKITDADLDDAVRVALRGLVHHSAA